MRHILEESDIHSGKKKKKKTEYFDNNKIAPFLTRDCTKRVKIVILVTLFVSNTDKAYVLYVRQLNMSGDLYKIEQRTPYKNTTAVSLIVKT